MPSQTAMAGTACLGDAELDCLDDLVEIHMTGNDLIVGADDADQRLSHLFLGKSKGIEQGTVRRLLHAFFDVVTKHGDLLFYVIYTAQTRITL